MIHQYKLGGYNIVIDANSGAVHTVDDVAYDIIAMYEGHKKSEIISEITGKYGVGADDVSETLSEIEELKENNLLFSDDPYKDIAADLKLKQSRLKAICLHVAHGCNMDCRYCFAGKGDYNHKAGLMSAEVGKRALDFLVRESKARKHLEVDLFGGEPLINWDVCKEVVRYGREIEKICDKKFNFTLTTNGLVLNDEIIDFVNKEMGNVVLSMDGRKETHDRMRHTKTGGGTYDLIMDNFKKMADSREDRQYYMRGTYTAYNKDFAEDVIHMADLGFRETSIEPVVGAGEEDYALKEEDLPILYDQYEKLAFEMINRKREGREFNFYHYSINMEGGPCVYKRIAGCGVGTEYLAVTPTGDLYPCHQFVGDDDFKVGDVWNGITDRDLMSTFEKNNIYTRDGCENCFARMYCAGGCAANNYHYNGDINKVYEFGCKLHRKRIECAIMMKVSENKAEINGV